jgi:polysaccharide export outer membrane protein
VKLGCRLPALLAATLVLMQGCAGLSLPSMGWYERAVPQPPSTTEGRFAGSAAAGAAPPNTAPVADPGYVIGPEDALEISVWKDDALKSATLVRPDGAISFPLIGEVMVAGKTATQVRDEVARRLDRFVPEPVVNVAVVRVASYRIYVIGRVNRPGEFPLGRAVDVLQALSLAGGMTPFANEEEIKIIRKLNGQSMSITFDYSRVRRAGDVSQNIWLQSGDVVLVP